MFDEDDEEAEQIARPWSWMHLAAVGANFAANIAKATWAFWDDIKDAANAHVAADDENRAAWDSMHRDLETL